MFIIEYRSSFFYFMCNHRAVNVLLILIFFKDRKPFYCKIYTLINEMLSLSPVAEFHFLWQMESNDSLQMEVFNKEESLWEGGGERSTVCDSPNVVFNIRSVCVLSRCQLALPIRQNSLRSQFMTSTLE